jgi:hypothetical protein
MSEAKHADVPAGAKCMTDSIAKQVAKVAGT